MGQAPIRLTAVEGYDLWASTWDSDESPVVSLEERTLAPLLDPLDGLLLLDLSCGTGRWMKYALERGARVVGADRSAAMLSLAAVKDGLSGRLALADVRRPPVGDTSADVVLCALSLGHIPNPSKVVRQLAEFVKPGGRLLVSDFHPDATRHGWKRTFRRGDLVFEVTNYPFEIPELLQAAKAVGLELETSIDAHFEEPERETFERAGREGAFAEAQKIPAVWVAAWSRPG